MRDTQRRPAFRPSATAAAAEHTPPTAPAEWRREAESHLRQAARALEVLGIVDGNCARDALIAYRIASRVRSDRLRAA